MHLLLAQKGALADDDEAIDLGQTPGDVLFVSAADTELAGLASAHDGSFELRLANQMRLAHPLSVDTWCENTVATSKLVIVRVLGGASYFAYGLDAIYSACRANGVEMIALPGDDKPDPSLDRFNTVPDEVRLGLWQLLMQGGPANFTGFLDATKAIAAGTTPRIAEPQPLLKAGVYCAGEVRGDLETLRAKWVSDRLVVPIIFYRALMQGGSTGPVDGLVEALNAAGCNPLPIYISSLKDAVSQEVVRGLFGQTLPPVVINLTGFAVSTVETTLGAERVPTVLEEGGAVVLQAVLSGGAQDAWADGAQGLGARDLAMNVALPEVDGRVLSRAIAFKDAARYDDATQCNIVRHEPVADRISFVAQLAANWARLRGTKPQHRNVALILANYPNRDGRLGNGVGLDTPAGTVAVLEAMAEAGYATGDAFADSEALMDWLQAGPTNAARDGREIRETLSLDAYDEMFAELPLVVRDAVMERWGEPSSDPYIDSDRFALPLSRSGNTFIGIQPARGYNIDPTETYHSPDLVPPHGYFAFYFHLRRQGVHATVHMGKHGNLEWLPGKALALSQACYPEAVLGPVPNIYPFIVNDPGEGTQAKRRTAAVIIDHLTPPLTRAESYGPLKELEALVDEYYEASGVDPRRLVYLKKEILQLLEVTGLDKDAGIDGDDSDTALEKLDAYLCELKEMQIRDGLHIFGRSPEGRLKTDLTVALARVPRGLGEGAEASLQRALAADLLDDPFDPLDCPMGESWEGVQPTVLQTVSEDPWRTNGDTVERIELLAAKLVSGELACHVDWLATQAVLDGIETLIAPAVESCGPAELDGLLTALDGRFVPPGPSGAPTRGRLDVLPTGRNFYSVDTRAVPTPAAWYLGQRSADLLLRRHRQEHGEWPAALALSAWGTSNMRTGGDDIAQALALIGVRPVWDHGSRRVTGTEIITLAELGRPRVDVTLRISGFFRDAFPAQIEIFDKACRAIAALDEDDADNPMAARVNAQTLALEAEGMDAITARRNAGHRIFGSKPGAYGAGLQALIDEKGWVDKADLAEAYLQWGSYAYGAKEEGAPARAEFESRLANVDAVVQNQDNREHDLLDSDDYYQFEGGITAAVEELSGERPAIYHNDHSRPERPVIRTLDEEIGRVVRARVVNPKWIAGVMRHGYKGAFEMAATVDYMFAFAATTGSVRDHHFDAVHAAYLGDDDVRDFIADKNPKALEEMVDRLLEAIERGLWTPRSNSAKFDLEQLADRGSAEGSSDG
ncbi:cobaltochelatase subunit CobN [Ahrensia sp. R2A130]|uniref:cobaltochelatase subunit CobN n=1 Tax=Ahrensia sp. R2A130 TaxID=744979 RepID=UPI0001E0AC6C|nr:cobaltochelatase subunit CobN [Ahrensia sp. R2A130]EFL90689.1 cobaltochelatase, CobN subunit [Ahrensia sp. R2A130]